MPAKFAATTLFSRRSLFLLGLRGRNVQFVLQWGQLLCGSKQVSGLPGDFTLNCVTSGFAVVVDCHFSALTLTSLYLWEKLGGFNFFFVGIVWFISPFPCYFRVSWSDMARAVVMFKKKSMNQKREMHKASQYSEIKQKVKFLLALKTGCWAWQTNIANKSVSLKNVPAIKSAVFSLSDSSSSLWIASEVSL